MPGNDNKNRNPLKHKSSGADHSAYKNFHQKEKSKAKPKIVEPQKVVNPKPKVIPKTAEKMREIRIDPPRAPVQHSRNVITKLDSENKICTIDMEESYSAPVYTGSAYGGTEFRNNREEVTDEDRAKRMIPWKPTEDDKLLYFYSKYPENWAKIAEHIGYHDKDECRKRYAKIKSNSKTEKWSQEEVDQLLKYYRLFGNKWKLISSKLPGRNPDQVKDKIRTLSKTMKLKPSNGVKIDKCETSHTYGKETPDLDFGALTTQVLGSHSKDTNRNILKYLNFKTSDRFNPTTIDQESDFENLHNINDFEKEYEHKVCNDKFLFFEGEL